MDEPHFRRLAKNHRAPRVALLLILALAGCKQLGIGVTKTENPVVPPPPDRKIEAESQTSSAKLATGPVKLDGSAAGQAPGNIPDAPGIAGAPILAGMPSNAGVPADGSTPPRGGGKGTAGKSTGGDPTAATSQPNDNEDVATDDIVLDDQAVDDQGEAPREPTRIAQSPKTGTSAKPGKITRVENRDEEDEPAKLDLVPETAPDVVTPIEVEGAGADFKKGQVAATVNGVPIFCDDIRRGLPAEVSQHMAQLERAVAEGKVKPEEYRDYRRRVIENYMQQHIQQEVLLQALKLKLKEEQLNGIKKQLDKIFDTEDLPAAMKKEGVATTAELEQKLQARGSSIDSLRSSSRNRQLAQQYLGTKAASNIGYDRPDVLKYYQDHLKDYAVTGKVKWEQIQLKFAQNGGKEGALTKANEICKRLDDGEIFAVVAKECSNGPTASKGGLWKWTEQGSIKAKEVDAVLFELPVGEISQPIETQTSIEIIRVTDRTRAGHQPFEDVQDEIKNQLKAANFQRRVNELLKDLIEKASIEKFTDKL